MHGVSLGERVPAVAGECARVNCAARPPTGVADPANHVNRGTSIEGRGNNSAGESGYLERFDFTSYMRSTRCLI